MKLIAGEKKEVEIELTPEEPVRTRKRREAGSSGSAEGKARGRSDSRRGKAEPRGKADAGQQAESAGRRRNRHGATLERGES